MKFPQYANSASAKAALGERLVNDGPSRKKAVAIATANAKAKGGAKENAEKQRRVEFSAQNAAAGQESKGIDLLKWIEGKERAQVETDAMAGKKKKKSSKKKKGADANVEGDAARLAIQLKRIAKELKKSARTERNVDADESLKMQARQQNQEQKSIVSKKLQLLATNM